MSARLAGIDMGPGGRWRQGGVGGAQAGQLPQERSRSGSRKGQNLAGAKAIDQLPAGGAK